MWKHILILTLILTVIGGTVFWTQHHNPRMERDAPTPAIAPQKNSPQQAREVENAAVPRETAGTEMQQMLRGVFPELPPADSITDPEMRKLIDIFNSPEFAAFAEAGDYSDDAYYGFLASQGIPWDRDAYYRDIQEEFQKHYPGETPESLDPYMRQTLTDLFAEIAGAFDLNTFGEAVIKFCADQKRLAWMKARFARSDDDFGEWGVEVLKAYMFTGGGTPEPFENQTPPVHPTDDSAAETDARKGEEISTSTTEPPPAPGTAPRTLEDADVLTEREGARDADIEAAIRKWLEQAPDDDRGFPFPTEASFEKRLRETFSPQRVNTALQTLTRYGPEEGMRRLQESDPDIAPHFEHLIQRQKETD